MLVRNELEDFHVQHLTDEQMAILNPIVRNAIYSALTLFAKATAGTPQEQEAAAYGLEFLEACVPSYWEPPQLTDDVAQLLAGKPPGRRASSTL